MKGSPRKHVHNYFDPARILTSFFVSYQESMNICQVRKQVWRSEQLLCLGPATSLAGILTSFKPVLFCSSENWE